MGPGFSVSEEKVGKIMKEYLVSVSQLAKIRGVSPQAIRKAIESGRIKARKIGQQWVINIQDSRNAKDVAARLQYFTRLSGK